MHKHVQALINLKPNSSFVWKDEEDFSTLVYRTEETDVPTFDEIKAQAVKDEAVGDPDNRDMVDRPSSPKKDMRDNENESWNPDGRDTVKQPRRPARDGNDSTGEKVYRESSSSNLHNPSGNKQNHKINPAKDGEEMKEMVKKDLSKRAGYVDIPALGALAKRFK